MAEPLAFWTTLWRILSMHWYAALLLLLPQPANVDTAKTPAKIVVSTLFFII